MTLGIGVQLPNSVLLYADSRVGHPYGPSEAYEKVFSAHGVTWLFAGDVSIVQHFYTVKCRAYKQGENFPAWFHRHMAPVWQAKLSIYYENSHQTAQDCECLAVASGHLWELSSGMCFLVPTKGYACIGSGAQYAYGAMAYHRQQGGDWDDFDWLQLVCKAVADIDTAVGPPFCAYKIAQNNRKELVWASKS